MPRLLLRGMEQKLSKKELAFLQYWEANRAKQRKLIYQLAFGLPIGLLLGAVILFNFRAGWYLRAEMEANASFNPVVLYVAIVIIALFIAIFGKKFQWEQRESMYRELKAKLESHAAESNVDESGNFNQ